MLEMECLKTIYNVRRIDQISNDMVKERSITKNGKYEKGEEGVLKWFGNMERMTKRVRMSEVEGIRKRGKPRRR